MSGDARITGRITITPPITKNELAGNGWAFRDGAGLYPDVKIGLDFGNFAGPDCGTDGLAFADPSDPVGPAIVPTGFETSARTLLDDVNRIVGAFATAPDGTRRTFGGWLHVVWGRGESVCRVHVVDGSTVESRPVLAWPDGARDEDGVA